MTIRTRPATEEYKENFDQIFKQDRRESLKIYLAGPMTGYPEFNFPAFMAAAKELRSKGYFVFNPAEKDQERHGNDFAKGNEKGSVAEAEKKGFSLRTALADDTQFICLEADGIAMLAGWEKSNGARAEHALACALGHKIIYLS